MEFLNTSIIISTVHAAKGLEWDYVILPDMEKIHFLTGMDYAVDVKMEMTVIL